MCEGGEVIPVRYTPAWSPDFRRVGVGKGAGTGSDTHDRESQTLDMACIHVMLQPDPEFGESRRRMAAEIYVECGDRGTET